MQHVRRTGCGRATQPPLRPVGLTPGSTIRAAGSQLAPKAPIEARPWVCTHAFGASGLAEQGGYKEQASITHRVAFAIRPAEAQDFWPVADVHCSVFYPRARPSAARIARLDRVVGMQTDVKLAGAGQGRATVLMATTRPGNPCPQGLYPPLPADAGLLLWARVIFDEKFGLEGLGTGATEGGVLGSACLDSFCDKIPPKSYCETDQGLSGRVGWALRSGLAYVSNVAVHPAARRQGVAGELMASAERVATEWGCRAITLHVDPDNLPAYRLYRKLGYRKAVQEPGWMPYLMGRPQERRWLMYKRLRQQQR